MGAEPKDTTREASAAELPSSLPSWARQLAELYYSGTTTTFVLTGNTFDLVPLMDTRFGTVAEFLSDQLFGRWDLVLRYDLARGLRCMAGSSPEKLKKMSALAQRRIGNLAELPSDPTKTLAVLDRFVTKNIVAAAEERLSVAIIFDHASYLVPRSERSSPLENRNLVTLLNWAASPYVKRLNMAFCLVDVRLADFSDRLTSNPHVASISVPLPDTTLRQAFLSTQVGEAALREHSDYDVAQLAEVSAGISLVDLNQLVFSGIEGGQRLDTRRVSALKKRLIERQAQDLLEFVEPRFGLEMVVGHVAAKRQLSEDAELIRRGALHSVPMGYLFCGPVGTGKSFLAQCAAGAIGIPCVKLKNFRSKYVGETEGNLERILNLLRSMGPVVVVVDEADAMLGDRSQGGDSGVGSRVFGMIAAQMGDTQYRGKIIWMLLTARPDLLPIDIKRQGRAEVHVPLFYPTDEAELSQMFFVLARKIGALLAVEDIPPTHHVGNLSGADVEGVIGKAWRRCLLAGQQRISREQLTDALENFMPSTQTLERQLQEIAAIIECTDRAFLPAAICERFSLDDGGRERLQERYAAIMDILRAQK